MIGRGRSRLARAAPAACAIMNGASLLRQCATFFRSYGTGLRRIATKTPSSGPALPRKCPEGVRYMNKKIPLLTLGAALIAVPVLAAPGGDRTAPQTRAEVQTRAAEMFAKLDANQDGKLDTADRAAKRAERQAKKFTRLDADGNGSISKAEWDQHGRSEEHTSELQSLKSTS